MEFYLQDADKKGLSLIAEDVKHLAQKAKDNALKPADYEVVFQFSYNYWRNYTSVMT